ncbi:YeiH family protein [Bacillus sp. FJAT-47783]|uniref:YeiH family protein n=1 Tax=Bacillus sp. FJAT-47783 TaxID=2922712 RepID=UPI001FACF3CD|nr:YeiH family protein [Bacillus sp. FJAT-47783]
MALGLITADDTKQLPHKKQLPFISGILFTIILAAIGWGLSLLPYFNKLGPMAIAILLAILYRQIRGYPELIQSGVEFTAKKILRIAIVLYGLKLNIQLILQEGLELLAIDAFVITFSILITIYLAKVLKANPMISLLVGIGTGVCGAAAIAAVSPILKSKDEETALSVGMIALMGTIFALLYTFIQPLLPLDQEAYGIWSGISLHELAHVALAAAPVGQDALAIALLAKLGRVFLLIPLCFILMYWMNRKNGANHEKATIAFPWFLIGFVIMSVIGSFITAYQPFNLHLWLEPIATVSSFLLTMAMVGLGLNVNLKHVRSKALKPLLALILASIALSAITLLISM